jgi:hypothetical protein
MNSTENTSMSQDIIKQVKMVADLNQPQIVILVFLFIHSHCRILGRVFLAISGLTYVRACFPKKGSTSSLMGRLFHALPLRMQQLFKVAVHGVGAATSTGVPDATPAPVVHHHHHYHLHDRHRTRSLSCSSLDSLDSLTSYLVPRHFEHQLLSSTQSVEV